MKYIRSMTFLALLALQVGLVWGAGAPPTQATVSVEPVLQQDVVQKLEIVGTISAQKTSQMDVETAGYVIEKNYDIGKWVKKDEVLLRLEPTPVQRRIEAVEAQLAEWEIDRDYAESKRARSRKLDHSGHIAEEDLERDEVGAKISVHRVERLRAELGGLRYQLERHVLKAPFDGLVGDNFVSTGRWLQPGQGALTLLSLEKVYIELELPENHLHSLDHKALVEFGADAWPAKKWKATLEGIAPSRSPGSRTVRLRYLTDNGEYHLLPGMSVRAQVPMQVLPQVLLVPKDAIVNRGTKRLVFAAVDHMAVATEIQIDGYYDRFAIVTAKLEAGLPVVVKGNEFLIDGRPLNVVAAP